MDPSTPRRLSQITIADQPQAEMVRRGSTVRVRQRALQKRRTQALSRSGQLAPRRTCAGYGADDGAHALASTCPGRAFAIGTSRASRYLRVIDPPKREV